MTFVGDAQRLGVELVEQVNQRTELRRLIFGTELEGLNGASNDLPGRHAERARLHIERRPLLR